MTTFLNTSAVARQLRLSSERVRQLARTGELAIAGMTTSGERLFVPNDVEAFEARRREQKDLRAVSHG